MSKQSSPHPPVTEGMTETPRSGSKTLAKKAGKKDGRNSNSPDFEFAERLKNLLRPNGKAKNPTLRTTIREALQISQSTLYYWQNPPKDPEKNKTTKPTRPQIIRLAMILADEENLNREELVSEMLRLGGYEIDPELAATTDARNGRNRIHNDLDDFYAKGKTMLKHGLPSGLQDGSSAISMGCYFSQHLLNELSERWKAAKRGGHIIFFWRWQESRILRYFHDYARKAMSEWLAGLIMPGCEQSTWVTVFLCLEGSELSPSQKLQFLGKLGDLGERIFERLTVYVDGEEALKMKKREFFDLGVMINPTDKIPFMMVSYPDLYQACIGLEQREKDALQAEFNPIQWTTNITLLGKDSFEDYRIEKQIEEPLPGSPIPKPDEKRWRLIKPLEKAEV